MMAMAILWILNLHVVLLVATWITMMIVMISHLEWDRARSISEILTMMVLVIQKFRYLLALFKKDM